MQAPPPLPPVDWFGRNWKWFIPFLIVTVAVFLGGTFWMFTRLMKSSGAYSGAMARARSSQAVIEALGTPIKDGYFTNGTVSQNEQTERANLVIPVSGPKASATMVVIASRMDGKWHFQRLIVQLDETGKQIDLLEKPSRHDPNAVHETHTP
jgi:hypothetical protein